MEAQEKHSVFLRAAEQSSACVLPQQLKKELDSGKKILLLDVRQPEEFNFVHLEHSVNVPLPELKVQLKNLSRAAEIVTICQHGNRSMHAAIMLHSLGYKVRSLKGGQDEWARQIAKNMKHYKKETYVVGGKIKCDVREAKD